MAIGGTFRRGADEGALGARARRQLGVARAPDVRPRAACAGGCRSPTGSACSPSSPRCARGGRPEEVVGAPRTSIPGSCARSPRSSSSRPSSPAGTSPRPRRRCCCRAKTSGLVGRAHRRRSSTAGEGELAAVLAEHGIAARLQAGRHLRRRVPRLDALPLLDLRRGGRERSRRPPEGGDPRLRAQPHRPGDRVRLLLRAGRLRPARRRVRDDDDQLQPGDRLDRLRHLRPPLLRAADPRARAVGPRPREAGRA